MNSAAAAPLVSIILVNWNGLADTRECLQSLARITYRNYSVIVVDNGSRNGDAAAIRAGHSEVTVIENGKNLGFTGGNNVGINYALKSGADYILCLNNDTVVDPGFLEPLVQALEECPHAGIATAAIYYHDQPERLSALGCWVDLSKAAPVGHIDDPPGHGISLIDTTEVAAVDGCVLLMRRAVALATGGFDDRFFAYVEDADLCFRARRAGWRCLAVPASHVWHKIGSTTGGEFSPTATHYYMRNSYRLVMRHGNRLERTLFHHKFKGLWQDEWEAFWLVGDADRSRWHDPRRLRELQDQAANMYISRLHSHGPRKRYLRLERAIRMLVLLQVKVNIAAANTIFPRYSQVYWKLFSISPTLVFLLPKPFLAFLSDRQKRRREKEARLRNKRGPRDCECEEEWGCGCA